MALALTIHSVCSDSIIETTFGEHVVQFHGLKKMILSKKAIIHVGGCLDHKIVINTKKRNRLERLL